MSEGKKKAAISEEKKRAATTSKKSIEAVLGDVARKFEGARTRRAGSIVLRLTGERGGDFYLHSTSTGCHVSREPLGGPPHIEVIGDADRICAVLDGSKEGRLQFYVGGIRVRGDLHYLSELAHEMGFIKERF